MRRNKFSLSHYKLFSGNFGYLIPISWYDVLPLDTVQHQTNALLRLAPLLAPVMHPVRVRIHHWFVPNRLIWEDWEDFITGGEDGTSTPTHPYFTTSSAVNEGTIHDYMGIPAEDFTGKATTFNALPFRAYNLIYNEHYRDQQIHSALTVPVASDSDATSYTLQRVSWEKDYFTTIREDDQLGDEVRIPVIGIGKTNQNFPTGPASYYESDGNYRSYTHSAQIDPAVGDENFYVEGDAATGGDPMVGVRVNDLRMAQAIHRYQEARNQYGARYVEYLKYIGIRRPSDARLQRPEYLGGGRQIVSFSEVLSTADSGVYTVGDMLGHGISALKSNRFRRFFEEHGIVMTLMSVVPKHILMHNTHRSWFRYAKEDYFQKELQGVGEEEVREHEIWNPTATNAVWGYHRRYESYKHIPSTVSSEFRSSLNHWHMARDLGAMPALNSTFIDCNPTTRIFAAPASDQMYVMASHSVQARRAMAKNL